MTEVTDKRPIHPFYKAASDESSKRSPLLIKVLGEAMETKDYSEIQKFRAVATEQLSKLPQPELIHTTQEVVGGPDNVKVKLEIFKTVGFENETLPIIFHGGGYVFGNIYTHGKTVFDFAVGVHAAVVFVDYSLSPEVKFPIATEEVFTALCWVRENAASINGDPEKIAVLGDSAGGNLSAVVSLMEKDRGLGDTIKAQVLIYPVVADTKNSPSREKVECFLESLLPQATKELQKPYASPLISSVEQLSGLPPALVMTAECDILRDEVETYSTKLLEADVEVVGISILGAIHSFISIQPPPAPQYRQGLNSCISFIREKLNLK